MKTVVLIDFAPGRKKLARPGRPRRSGVGPTSARSSDCVLTTVFSSGKVWKDETQQAARPGFDGDETERGDGQPVIGLEVVQQAALEAVAQDFVVDVQEDLRRQDLDLKAGLISHAGGQDSVVVQCSPRTRCLNLAR